MNAAPAPADARGLLACAIGLFAGVLLMLVAVRSGILVAFDAGILRGLRVPGHPEAPIGPHWLERFVRDVTVLGGGRMLTLLVIGVAGLFAARRQGRAALLLIVATYAGSAVETLIKALVGRVRPEIVPHLVAETSLSFPSAHAANSSLVFLMIAALAIRNEADRATRRYAISVAIVLTALVGASRGYLGVHWPSDILAGWCFGGGWAALSLVVAQHVLPETTRAT